MRLIKKKILVRRCDREKNGFFLGSESGELRALRHCHEQLSFPIPLMLISSLVICSADHVVVCLMGPTDRDHFPIAKYGINCFMSFFLCCQFSYQLHRCLFHWTCSTRFSF